MDYGGKTRWTARLIHVITATVEKLSPRMSDTDPEQSRDQGFESDRTEGS
jgi:hypothetical protein